MLLVVLEAVVVAVGLPSGPKETILYGRFEAGCG